MTKKTVQELRDEIAKLQAELAEQRKEEIQQGLAELIKVINSYELTYSDVQKTIKKRFPDASQDNETEASTLTKNTPPKFINPDDNSQTWSGSGNPVKWVKTIIDKNRESDPDYRFVKDTKYRNPNYPWKR
jgi:DNA-binding protein H-NS